MTSQKVESPDTFMRQICLVVSLATVGKNLGEAMGVVKAEIEARDRKIAKLVLEAALEKVTAEALTDDTETAEDEAYNHAIADCEMAIRSLSVESLLSGEDKK